MNIHTALILGMLACDATASSVLRFFNSDSIVGSPRDITAQQLVWDSPLLLAPAIFSTEGVIDISLPANSPTEFPETVAHLTLTNGDQVRGQLVAITDESVTIDTWFAGRMVFNRLMTAKLTIEGSQNVQYHGPTGLDDWVQVASPPAWTYQHGAFRSELHGGIARDKLLTEQCSIAFDLAWKNDSMSLKMVIFSDNASTDTPETGYELRFQRGRVHIINLRTRNFIGSTQARALLENDGKARIEIRASAKNNRIALLVDDEPIEIWKDPDADKAKLGQALHFINSGRNAPVKISNIRVREWNGVMERMPEPLVGLQAFGMGQEPEVAEPSPQDKADDPNRIKLVNGDCLTGELESIRSGLASIKTKLGEIEIPILRLKDIPIQPANAERCKRYNGDVRAWLPDGSSIVFRLDESTPESFTGFSQNFGTATFRIDAFSRIEFNIYSLDYEQRKREDTW